MNNGDHVDDNDGNPMNHVNQTILQLKFRNLKISKLQISPNTKETTRPQSLEWRLHDALGSK